MAAASGEPGLLRLSSELLRDILDYIEADPQKLVSLDRRAYLSQESFRLPGPPAPDQIQDVANFRLVCRRFSELGAIHQFSRLATRFSRHGFARLEKIAAQPHLARHVKKFSYMVPYFYEPGSQRQRERALASLQPGPGSIDARKFLLKADEQRELVSSGEDARVLKTALAAFTSLQHVQILRVQDQDDALLLTWLRRNQDETHFLELRWAPACSHSTRTLGAALLDTQSPCSRFSSPMLSPQSAEVLASNTPSSFQVLVQRLTSLELHFDDGNDLDTTMAELSSLFRRIFTSAENMQALHIGFPSHRPLSLRLDDIFHKIKWRYLAAFGIQAWKLDAEDIISLVRRHRDRLRGLRLRDVLLKDGSHWKDVLGFLRREVPHLEWVSLRRIGYAKGFDELWTHRGAEVPDDPPGAPSDSDDDLSDGNMTSLESNAGSEGHDDDDSDDESLHDNDEQNHDHDRDDDDDDNDDDSDNDSTRDAAPGNMGFPLRATAAHSSPAAHDSPDSTPCCCDTYEDNDRDAYETDMDIELLNDNAMSVSNVQRKAWERWVLPRKQSRVHVCKGESSLSQMGSSSVRVVL